MKEYNISVPSSWDEITLEMFDGIALAEGNPYDKTIEILNVLTGIPENELKNMPAIVLESSGINEKLSFLAKEPRKKMPQEKITLNGSNFIVNLYPAKWTAAQYLDYNSVLASGERKKLARIIACFTVPEGKKYGEDYDFDKVVDTIYEFMPVTLAMGYAGFFQLQLTSFVKALSAYSERKKKKLTRRQVSRLYKKSQKEASTQSGIPLS